MPSKRQSGSVYLILLVMVLLVGFVAIGIYMVAGTGDDKHKFVDKRAAYDAAVAAMEKAMSDPANIEFSMKRNESAFQCLYTQQAECSGKGGAFLLYQAGASPVVVSHLVEGMGLDLDGIGCNGFPSESCPLRAETNWEPVCAPGRCENTKSFQVKARVTLVSSDPKEKPLEWTKEQTYSPRIELSKAVICERSGSVWANTECLSPAQAAERQLASRPDARVPSASIAGDPPVQPEPQHFECPNQIVVQGNYHPVQFLSADRAQVSVPAMSCPVEGAFDVFVFQCSGNPHQPGAAQGTPEGQWVQVEAVMAPPCDSNGSPVVSGGDARL